MNTNIILIIQVVMAIFTIMGILLQQRGSGLSSALGGDNSGYATRRGAEKTIFIATIVAAILFFGISIARLVI